MAASLAQLTVKDALMTTMPVIVVVLDLALQAVVVVGLASMLAVITVHSVIPTVYNAQ